MNMKYVIILGDGMADEPINSLEGKTPLEYAKTPVMDLLSKQGEIGIVSTIPKGMKPGSDTANLAVLGYNPKEYYSGRSPLEALSIGVPMIDSDIALRCNLVTLSEEEEISFGERTILDHSSGEIETKDSNILLNEVKAQLENERYHFYCGTSYRHCMIWNNGSVLELSQPHDHLGEKIAPYLPKNEDLLFMMKKSYDILKNHPINIERKKKGLRPGNCCWFWGAGTKPELPLFEKKFGKKGSMISAVDLLKGIAVGTGMNNIEVEGANGGLYTNYEGKARAGVKALTEDDYDFVYIHVEAPDEMGHQGSVEKKIKAIEFLDEKVVKVVKEGLDNYGEPYRILIMPDHPTPICIRTHTAEPVPYLFYYSIEKKENVWNYNEREAKASGNKVGAGHEMIIKLFSIK